MKKARYDVLSFFSGAMGFDLGIEKAGFKTIFANEIDPCSVETIRKNRPNIMTCITSIAELTKEKIETLLNRSIADVPLIVGGPPCQAFSIIGKRKGIADSRGTLVYEFARIISEIKPQCFIMENVRGLHSMPLGNNLEENTKGGLLKDILKKFESIGYHVDCFLVNAVNYGTPQIRERLICIGNKYNIHTKFLQPQYSNRPEDGLPAFKTLRTAIGDRFEDPDTSLMNFSPRKLNYLQFVPPGGNWRNMPIEIQKESMGKSWYLKGGRSAFWRRLSFDYPSPTIVTMPNHASTSLCHPTELRALTVGECAAVQGFPAEWFFSGSAADKYRQIGNAVPPRLGEVSGAVVYEVLTQINEKKLQPAPPDMSTITHIRPHVRTRTYWKNGKVAEENESYYTGTGSLRQGNLI